MAIKTIAKILLLLSALCLLPASAAPVETFQFESEQAEKSFHKLSEELRCLVCQNQSIAESNAGLAKDLRLELYNMLSQGKSEDEIIDFMVQRYGDYVLYRPPFKPLTWLLWLGPLLVFGIAVFFVIRQIRGLGDRESGALSAEEQARINRLQAVDAEVSAGDEGKTADSNKGRSE